MKKHSLKVKKAKNIKEKVQGLIGKDKPYAMMLETRFGIHTFGLRFPIDVVILDDKNKIVSIRENMKPCRIFLWNPRYKKVLELPAGTIRKGDMDVDDHVVF